jgi:protein-S-isoprenylcysteine O-methyltransferase Ste14
MMQLLNVMGWLACVVYSTIPAFWIVIHPRAHRWRLHRSPYRILVPAWITMWLIVAALTAGWRSQRLYSNDGSWLPAILLFAVGLWLYFRSSRHFSAKQLGGVPEVLGTDHDQRLVTSGIRARVRHPIYLAHLCEMIAWSIGTGLLVCYALTVFAIITGAVMIRMEDAELESRFGEPFRQYRKAVPAVLPRLRPDALR